MLKDTIVSFISNIIGSFYFNDSLFLDKKEEEPKCELIGTFSLITQASLGLLCVSSLIIKRLYEYPLRRTWKVWGFDVSKQLIGALGVHFFNLALSILKAKGADSHDGDFTINLDDTPNDDNNDAACDWYFLNIVLDCTIGVLILNYIFIAFNYILKRYFKVTGIESGYYGNGSSSPSFKAYFKQLSIYFGSLMLTKLVLYVFVICFQEPLLWITSNVLLVWLNDYTSNFEIFVVIFIVPVVMNCIQLILIDNIIQNKVLGEVNHRHLGIGDLENIDAVPPGFERISNNTTVLKENQPDTLFHKITYNSVDSS